MEKGWKWGQGQGKTLSWAPVLCYNGAGTIDFLDTLCQVRPYQIRSFTRAELPGSFVTQPVWFMVLTNRPVRWSVKYGA